MPVKFGYFVVPHIGGTFSVYRNLREGLRPAGIDLHWIGVGQDAEHAIADSRWGDERAWGVVVSDPGEADARLAQVLVDRIVAERFQGVFINVLADRLQTNIARYLPPHILRILIVHNITPATYNAARAVHDFVHATVAITPRIRADLVRRFHFDGRRVFVIPHGIRAEVRPVRLPPDRKEPLRLIFVGRCDDAAKGVFWLPKIVEQAPGRLTVAGDGPDAEELRRRFRPLKHRVDFVGAIAPEDVQRLLEEHDLLLAPSRFEGFGLVLAEGMASGCVPVASWIRGVTDLIVESGTDGLLFPVGDVGQAASHIRKLNADRGLLASMRDAARRKVMEQFGCKLMATRYIALLDRLAATPPPIAAPLPLSEWRMPAELGPGLRRFVPLRLKNLARVARERLA